MGRVGWGSQRDPGGGAELGWAGELWGCMCGGLLWLGTMWGFVAIVFCGSEICSVGRSHRAWLGCVLCRVGFCCRLMFSSPAVLDFWIFNPRRAP